jgi:hypothetical protein
MTSYKLKEELKLKELKIKELELKIKKLEIKANLKRLKNK